MSNKKSNAKKLSTKTVLKEKREFKALNHPKSTTEPETPMILMSTPEPESETMHRKCTPENEITTALLPSPGPET